MHELRTEPRQRRSQQSIDAILDAAQRLVHDQGQVSFTAAELAAGAQMSIGRVYYWFPDIPSVVGALVERTAQRMVETCGAALTSESSAPTRLLIERMVDLLCDHLDRNPATVALTLTGGADSQGEPLYRGMVELVGKVVTDRGVPEAEQQLVAHTVVAITLGMLHGYTRAGDLRSIIRQELVFVLSAWLSARYPSSTEA